MQEPISLFDQLITSSPLEKKHKPLISTINNPLGEEIEILASADFIPFKQLLTYQSTPQLLNTVIGEIQLINILKTKSLKDLSNYYKNKKINLTEFTFTEVILESVLFLPTSLAIMHLPENINDTMYLISRQIHTSLHKVNKIQMSINPKSFEKINIELFNKHNDLHINIYVHNKDLLQLFHSNIQSLISNLVNLLPLKIIHIRINDLPL